jgi:epoxyqueuosine reductase
MERNIDKRLDPTILVPNAKSVVTVLLNYFPGSPMISTTSPKISRYAISLDYHVVVKDMLYILLEKLRKEYGSVNGRAFVDSAPVLERAWAVKAGLGWIGKNGMLINPKIGSYTFIGELIIDIDIETSSTQIPNRCGSCNKCIEACPTDAIVLPYTVDARKCISYLTIEKKTTLTEKERENLSDWCFGCDICQEVCPWNRKVKQARVSNIQPLSNILSIDKERFANLREEEFEAKFAKTPIIRAGFNKFVDNCKSI